ncbi:MAG: thrombospondin type 3 repeat-containing protein, partial [Sediminibacterium sp.]|nr:thrombospondin type 3 repeat-containing protein [Sediminibacterium sp.]
PRTLLVIPVGGGVRWMVSPRIAVNAEALMRFSFSDYIDGFSYAANPKHNDGYYGLSLGVGFILGENGMKCPRVRK